MEVMVKEITRNIIIITETTTTITVTIAIIVTITATIVITATIAIITTAIIIEIITIDITTIQSMAINIAVFVPAGIAIGSDNLAYRRNEDDGAIFAESVSTFAIHNRFLISFVGDGFINEKPYDYYIELISVQSKSLHFQDIRSFDEWLLSFWKEEKCIVGPTYYLAGFDITGTTFTPVVLLCENYHSSTVNTNEDQYVYYYHSCGRNEWIEKVLLDTCFEDRHSGEKIELQRALIDFSKFSIKLAVSFISILLKLSAHLDSFCSIRNNVGNTHTILVVTPTGTYEAQSIKTAAEF